VKQDNDGELRKRFAALRNAMDDRVPMFTSMRRRLEVHRLARRSTGSRVRLAMAAALILVITAISIARLAGPDDATGGTSLSDEILAGTWTAPTDFLLDFPGASYFRSVPRIGTDIGGSTQLMPTPPNSTRSPDSRNQS